MGKPVERLNTHGIISGIITSISTYYFIIIGN